MWQLAVPVLVRKMQEIETCRDHRRRMIDACAGALEQGVQHKDIGLGILGAAGALAGLVLVFLGVVVAAYQAYDPGTKAKVLQPFRRMAIEVLIVFGVCMLAIVTSLLWLLVQGEPLFWGMVAIFVLQLGAIGYAAVRVTYRVVLRS